MDEMETRPVSERQARTVHRLALTFYGVAATAAVIGQTWVAVDHLPWPDDLAPVWRVAAVAPFALVLELLAVVLAVMADYRMRLGERAVTIRLFSAVVAVIATGVIVVGHGTHAPYLAVGFGALSASAYLLSQAHMAMRRRDAMRDAGLLATVPPSYGAWRWVRRPVLTARASELARERGLGLYESIRAAEDALAAERRRPAIAAAVEQAIRASHPDRRMAEIAVSTLDLDRIAAELEASADYAGWAERLAPAVTAPESPGGDSPDSPPLYVPDSWVSQDVSQGGDSAADSDGESPGESVVPRQVSHRVTRSVTQGVSHPRESAGESPGESAVPDELIHRARESAADPAERMAWLWHATSGQASGRELARAGEVSASTGIRRAAQWRTNPPVDPRR